MKLTNEQIDKIADELDSGMICYINLDTGEYRVILEYDDMYDVEEFYEEEMKEIEKNIDKYFQIKKMSSSEAYRVMESFVNSIQNREKQMKVKEILNRKSPFANFKEEIEYDDKYRQKWFNHKRRKYNEYVRRYLVEKFELEELSNLTVEDKFEINLEGKIFTLLKNSTTGEADESTIFEYNQDEELVTAEYKGGNIRYGKVIGKITGDELEMIYQCITNKGELKCGKSKGVVKFTEKGKMKLEFEWGWLNEGQFTGRSEYIEK